MAAVAAVAATGLAAADVVTGAAENVEMELAAADAATAARVVPMAAERAAQAAPAAANRVAATSYTTVPRRPINQRPQPCPPAKPVSAATRSIVW